MYSLYLHQFIVIPLFRTKQTNNQIGPTQNRNSHYSRNIPYANATSQGPVPPSTRTRSAAATNKRQSKGRGFRPISRTCKSASGTIKAIRTAPLLYRFIVLIPVVLLPILKLLFNPSSFHRHTHFSYKEIVLYCG